MMTTSIKKNILRGSIFLLIGIFLIPAMASAFRQGPGKPERGIGMPMKTMQWSSFKIWNNPKLVEDLGLSDDQISKLKDADFAMKEKHIELRSQLNRLSLDMERAFAEQVVNDSEVLELANKMSEIRNQLFMDRVETGLKMKKILTDEQFEKLASMQFRSWEDRKRFGKYEKRGRGYWQKDMIQE